MRYVALLLEIKLSKNCVSKFIAVDVDRFVHRRLLVEHDFYSSK